MDSFTLKRRALGYHNAPRPGKLAICMTKPTASQEDLSLAYTPGVAEPVLEIAKHHEHAYRYTAKGNLVAVITNGTAVLGLGNVGPLASKPVMEGKAVLFKRFADIDVFDIEVDANDSDEFVRVVRAISPTFGGINLEDIKAPECFDIEERLIEALDIPVFHDDQHGTAIVVAAGLLNALELQAKALSQVKIVCVGAGAAGIASMNLLLALGAQKENLYLLDSQGVIHAGRSDLNKYKSRFAHDTDKRSLEDAITDADVFIGLAKPDLLNVEHLLKMAPKAVVFALSNPDPEIHPDLVRKTRPDIIVATGRSDFANQVNNVLCFPYIFRGALDVRASKINKAMQVAAVHAIRELAKENVPSEVRTHYPRQQHWSFGPDYILPKPIDPRLGQHVSAAVSKAALETGVADSDFHPDKKGWQISDVEEYGDLTA